MPLTKMSTLINADRYTLIQYIIYCESQIDLEEMPLTYGEWLDSQDSKD